MLLIAGLNVANLLVARAAARKSELAIRTTLGGSRSRLLSGQFLECLLPSAALTFTIQSLSANGSGTAFLSCGTGCGWNLNIQVAHNGQMFNMVDVTTGNPGNFVEGSAIRQF